MLIVTWILYFVMGKYKYYTEDKYGPVPFKHPYIFTYTTKIIFTIMRIHANMTPKDFHITSYFRI